MAHQTRTENTPTDRHKVVYQLPSTEPYERPVLFISFSSDDTPLDQAIAMIKKHRPDMWDILEKGYSCGFLEAVRARDYFALLRVADQRNQYLLPCWLIIMTSSLFTLVPPREGQC